MGRGDSRRRAAFREGPRGDLPQPGFAGGGISHASRAVSRPDTAERATAPLHLGTINYPGAVY